MIYDQVRKNNYLHLKSKNPHTCSKILPDIIDHKRDYERAAKRKEAQKKLNTNLYAFNQSQTETSGLVAIGSSYQPPVVEGNAFLPTLPESPVLSKAVEVTTDKLPRVTASRHHYYETNDAPVLSKEETRKNVRPVPKEKDVGSILESYQKAQITPTTVGYTAPPVVQTKTKPPPAKTVPSSSGSKSHKSLPRRSCLVYLKEQYHLDVDLLAQPRATKYLVKVRTEISPGRYMAKLELHCSR